MNILFLAPRLPLASDTIRTFNMLKQLVKTNQVHLVCFSFGETNQKKYIDDFESSGVKITFVPMGKTTLVQKITGVLFKSIPFSIAKYHTPYMRQTIENILKDRSFDAVHIDHLHMAHYIDCFKNIPCFLDEHNVEFRILERCGNVEASFPRKLLYQQQSIKMKSFETQKVKEFTGVFACSSDDKKILDDITSGLASVHVIPNSVDTEYFTPSLNKDLTIEKDTLVFTGSMDWLPNEDAVLYFFDKILPLIWQKKGSVKFYVVGKNPSASVKALATRDTRVIVTGRVEDVRPYVLRSKAVVIPLRIGGGTRLKILEAMAMNKPIVSTTIGAEGIEYKDGKDILLADEPQAFADKVLLLLNDEQRSQEIGNAARKLVCDKYVRDTIGLKVKAIYEEAVK